MEPFVLQPTVDNSKLNAGLNQMESIIDSRVRAIQNKMATAGTGRGVFSAFSAATPNLSAFESQLARTSKAGDALGRSLDRIGSTLTSGLGFGLAVGGLALLERAFDKAIGKAKEFQTAQLAIAATLQSSYKLIGSQGEVTGGAGFNRMLGESGRLNREIIKRQAVNILTYEEQLGAFQSSLNAGARKGLRPNQVMDVSEQLAIVAKTLGLRGEEIANASRIGLGGAVNISRSTIGRALGITNEDISKRQGSELVTFLQGKTKGFQAGAPSFAKSIEGVTSTLEAQIDVFMAKVGEKFMKNATPIIQQFGKALEGQGAEKFADNLTTLFSAILKAVEAIAKSPAIPVISKFLEYLASFGDKILIVGILGKLTMALGGVAAGAKNLVTDLKGIASSAIEAAGSLNVATASAASFAGVSGEAGMSGVMAGRSRGSAVGGASMLGAIPLGANLTKQEASMLYQMAHGQVKGTRPRGANGRFISYKEASLERMREIQNAALAKQTRAAGNAAFDEFAMMGMMGGPGSLAEIEGGVAKGVAGEAEKRRALRNAKIGAFSLKALDKLQRGAMAGGMAFMGTELIKGQTDQSDNLAVRAGGGFLQGAVTSGVGLAAMGVPAPVAAGIGVLVGITEGLNSAFKALEEQVKSATEAFEAMKQQFPNATRITELKTDMGMLTGADSLLTDRTKKGVRERYQKMIEDQREAGRAKVMTDTDQKELEGKVQKLQANLQALGLGYGIGSTGQKLGVEGQLREAQIGVASQKGELPVSAGAAKQGTLMFQQYEAMRARARASGQKLPEGLLKFRSEEEAQQYFARAEMNGQVKSWKDDQEKLMGFRQQELMSRASDTFGGGLAGDRSALESKLIGEKGSFSSIGGYNAYVQRMRATMARQQKEQTVSRGFQIAGSLANRPQDAERFNLEASLVGRRKDFDTNEQFQAFSQKSRQELAMKQRMEALGGGGLSPMEQFNRAVRDASLGLQSLATESKHAKENYALSVQGRGIEDARRSFDQSRQDVNYQRMVEDRSLAKEAEAIQAKAGIIAEQEAKITEEAAEDAPTLRSGVGPYAEAAAAIRYKVESEQGFNAQEFEAAYRRSVARQKELDELAVDKARLHAEEVRLTEKRLSLNIARSEEDYQNALKEYTLQLQERAQAGKGLSTKRGQEDENFKLQQQQMANKMGDMQSNMANAGLPGVGGGLPSMGSFAAPSMAGIGSALPSGAPGQAGGGMPNVMPSMNIAVDGKVALTDDAIQSMGQQLMDSFTSQLKRDLQRSV